MPPPTTAQIDAYLKEDASVTSEGSGANPVFQAIHAARLFPLTYRSVSEARIPLPTWSRYRQDAPNPIRTVEWRNIIITARITLCEDAYSLLTDVSNVLKEEAEDVEDFYGKGSLLMEKLVGFRGKNMGSTKNKQLITYVENQPGTGRGCGTVFYPFLEFDRECDYQAAVIFITNRIRRDALGGKAVFELEELDTCLVRDRVMAFLASRGIEQPPSPVEEAPPEEEPPPPPAKKRK
ncbi:hypothetical protein SELMODRAFT_406800 [Selaginella moellendorffii]|uniref:Uncharacterized protein n=1 Tax=Selaginella moellendorffii TaxID=88036 RepID=D8R2Z4_SELML|nr:hypothetical protein SELMODRAFT_406800 [Selaginella moellendorffii]